jgi:hypothetical protein
MPPKILTSFAFTLAILSLFLSPKTISRAKPLTVYSPPAQVTVQMYRLNDDGSAKSVKCTTEDTNWGCTAFCGSSSTRCASGPVKPYPYSSDAPPVQIENEYLLDVVSLEAYPDKLSAVAVEANAVVARSFTYGHIQANSTIDNSTNKHVFVPYYFEWLNSTDLPNNPANVCSSTNLNQAQQKVCNGAARRYYVSYGTAPNDDYPAVTEYFADIRNATVTGTTPYEISVADPISSNPDVPNSGHGRGMSQRGASRWGYGNVGYSGNLTPWSVQWTQPEHILFHYYTGVHLRDANSNNARLSPDYRWNPLVIDWGSGATRPPDMQVGTTYNMNIQLQNTGAVNWGSDVRLSCQWKKPDGSIVNCQTEANPGALAMGAPAPTITLPVSPNTGFTNGLYTLMIDMKQGSTFFHNREAGKPWPTLNYNVCIGGNCGKLFLPLVTKNWAGLNLSCDYFIQTWYPTGINGCDPYVLSCDEGDGQPDGVYAGPWNIGGHQVGFSPQLVLPQTWVGTYWKSIAQAYGTLYIDVQLGEFKPWTRVHTAAYQSSTQDVWTGVGIGQYEGNYLTGLRFGFFSPTGSGLGHQFIVAGYRMDNFFSCAP